MYCSNCGTILDKQNYCQNCNHQGGSARSMPYIPPSYPFPQGQQLSHSIPSYYHLPPTRSYFTWYFGSIVIVLIGLFMIIYFLFMNLSPKFILFGILLMFAGVSSRMVYSFFNFKDFRDLNRATHGGNMYDSSIDPALAILIQIFFGPAAVYIKYKQLYSHLTERHEREEKISPHPIIAVIILNFSGIFMVFAIFASIYASTMINRMFIGFSPIFGLFAPILFYLSITLYLENKWQSTLNYHIQKHKSFIT